MIPTIPANQIRARGVWPKWETVSGGTISTDKKSATQTSASTALAALGHIKIPQHGKWYCEFEVSDTGSLLAAVGLAFGLASEPVCAPRSNAALTFVAGGVTSATQSTWTAGRIMMAVDYIGAKAWFGRNGTWFASGNPAANSSPYYSVLPTGLWRLWCHGDNDGSGVATIRIYAGRGEIGYAPPSGFGTLI